MRARKALWATLTGLATEFSTAMKRPSPGFGKRPIRATPMGKMLLGPCTAWGRELQRTGMRRFSGITRLQGMEVLPQCSTWVRLTTTVMA